MQTAQFTFTCVHCELEQTYSLFQAVILKAENLTEPVPQFWTKNGNQIVLWQKFFLKQTESPKPKTVHMCVLGRQVRVKKNHWTGNT